MNLDDNSVEIKKPPPRRKGLFAVACSAVDCAEDARKLAKRSAHEPDPTG